jgi:hypothetical protein
MIYFVKAGGRADALPRARGSSGGLIDGDDPRGLLRLRRHRGGGNWRDHRQFVRSPLRHLGLMFGQFCFGGGTGLIEMKEPEVGDLDGLLAFLDPTAIGEPKIERLDVHVRLDVLVASLGEGLFGLPNVLFGLGLALRLCRLLRFSQFLLERRIPGSKSLRHRSAYQRIQRILREAGNRRSRNGGFAIGRLRSPLTRPMPGRFVGDGPRPTRAMCEPCEDRPSQAVRCPIPSG